MAGRKSSPEQLALALVGVGVEPLKAPELSMPSVFAAMVGPNGFAGIAEDVEVGLLQALASVRNAKRQWRFDCLVETVIEFVTANPGLTGNAVIKELGGSRDAVRKALRAGQQRGLLRSIPDEGTGKLWFPVAAGDSGGLEAEAARRPVERQ